MGPLMSGSLAERLERLLPNGRGIWIPMDHGLSGYPEVGLDRMDMVIDSIIEGGADAIVCQKGVLSHQHNRTGWDGFVCHVSASTAHGGDCLLYTSPSPRDRGCSRMPSSA